MPRSCQAGETVIPVRLGLSESTDRWQQLQALRRGRTPVQPWLEQLNGGSVLPAADLLAALIAQLDRAAVEQLLSGPVGRDPFALRDAARQELPSLATETRVQQAWLEPLLALPSSLVWLEIQGHFRDARVADRLRGYLEGLSGAEREQPEALRLLPLLGRQRRPQDAELLIRLALEPAPSAWRRAAMEGLAVGLSAWPLVPLCQCLQQLAGDLEPGLAAQAVDLLDRLPDGQRQLRLLQKRELEPAVAARVRRRLQHAPLVLMVHGRQGGVIPEALQLLAAELEQRRAAPVLLQALTAAPPEADGRFWLSARRAGALTLMPLLLLPGEHVRRDVPAIAAHWQRLAERTVVVRRLPFLGAWPDWQELLATVLAERAGGRPLLWLHHPLQGALSDRFLTHLGQVLGYPGAAASYSDPQASLAVLSQPPALLAPLTLAPNRLSESLNMGGSAPSAEVLPPLLDLSAVRDFLLANLEALP
jgi:hypothetical protein